MTTHGQRINELDAGKSVVLEKVLPAGSLEARRLRSGRVQFYWRFTQGSQTQRIPIGTYDPAAPPKSLKPTVKGYSIQGALQRARELSHENAETPGGIRAAEERRKHTAAVAAEAEVQQQSYTLGKLCAVYVGWLKAGGKAAWREAEIIFKNHVDPGLGDRPAAQVEKREIVAALRRLTEGGKTTTARKLRAYLRSAYACAVRADSDAALPSSFISYHVVSNPVDGIAAIKGAADKNPLNAAELRRYWKFLQTEDGVIGAALRLHVVSGGQRVQQLARVTNADVSGGAMRLMDPKGKRAEAREHLLPMTKQMRHEVDKLAPKGFLLSTDGGKTPMHPTSLSAWAADIGARAQIEGFQLKRVRSGVETLLAGAGVSREIRGQLQSHGLGGVQERHYDAHQYLQEKRRALETLYRLLDRSPGDSTA